MIKKLISILIVTAGMISCSEKSHSEKKHDILTVVTTSKEVQQIILDYLDIPDQLIHTFTGISTKQNKSHIIEFSDRHYAIGRSTYKAHPIQIHEIETGKLVASVPHTRDNLCHVAFSRDSRYLCVQGLYNKKVQIIDTSSKQIVSTFKQITNSSDHPVTLTTFSPDNKYIAAFCAKSGKIKLWQTLTGTEVYSVELTKLNGSSCRFLVFSPDSNYVAFAHQKEMGVIDIAAKSMRYIDMTRSWYPWITSLSFTPDSKYVHCIRGAHEIIDVKTNKVIGEHGHNAALIHDPRGQYVLCTSPHAPCHKIGTLRILNVKQLRRDNKSSSSALQLQFLNNGTYLIARYNLEPQEIRIYKNQALDLDCHTPTTMDLPQGQPQQRTSTCIIS